MPKTKPDRPKTFEQLFSCTPEIAYADLRLNPDGAASIASQLVRTTGAGLLIDTAELKNALTLSVGKFRVKKDKVLKLIVGSEINLGDLADYKLLTPEISKKLDSSVELAGSDFLRKRDLTQLTQGDYQALGLTRRERLDLICDLAILSGVQNTLMPEAMALDKLRTQPRPASDRLRTVIDRPGTAKPDKAHRA